jgi:2-haloacid dehalogenase
MVPDRKAQAGGATAEPIVVFDIGNVLLRWDPRFLYERIFDDRSKMESFLSEICTPEWNLELDRGGRFDEAVATLSAKHPNFEAEIRAFDERWLEMIPHAITDNVAVLAGLKAAGRPVYAITNFSAEKFLVARENFPFLDDFDGVVVSAQERLLKPDAAIYQVLFLRYGLRAHDCVFIDDSAANIETALTLGMQAIHFTEGVDVAARLRQCGCRF